MLSCSAALFALLQATEPGFPQYPALAPDGRAISFSWAGDLWLVSAEGGAAERLTSHPALELRSAFAPGGRRIAFDSNREGAQNLYTASIDVDNGVLGPIARVGFGDASQTLSGFSADGAELLYASWRESGTYRSPRSFRVELDGAPVRPALSSYGHSFREFGSGGGGVFARGRVLGERPGYRGPGTGSIWTWDGADGFAELASDAAHEAEPFPLPDGDVVFLSSRGGQNGIWRVTPGAEARLLFQPELAGAATIGHGVRDLAVSADGSTAAFCLWDGLFTLALDGDPAAGPAEARRIDVDVSGDGADGDRRLVDFSDQVSEAVLSPDGKTLAVVSRGEVFVRPAAEGRPARRVTHTAGRERDLAWSPDGGTLYFASDAGEPGVVGERASAIQAARVALQRGDLAPEPLLAEPEEERDEVEAESAEAGEEAQEDAPQAEQVPSEEVVEEVAEEVAEDDGEAAQDGGEDAEEPEAPNPGEAWEAALRFEVETLVALPGVDLGAPLPSPDGTRLLYRRGLGDLVLRELQGGEERVVLESWDEPEALWLEDACHVVYSVSDLDFNSDIWIADVSAAFDSDAPTFAAVNLTRHPDIDHSPRVSADGRWLYFMSDRGGENWSFGVWRTTLDEALLGLEDWEFDLYFERAAKAAGKREPLAVALEKDGAEAAAEQELEPEEPESVATEPEEAEPEDDDASEAADAAADEPAGPQPYELDLERAWRRAEPVTRGLETASQLVLARDGGRFAVQTEIDGDAGLYSWDRKGEERKRVDGGRHNAVTLDFMGQRAVFVAGGVPKSAGLSGGDVETHAIQARARVELAAEQRQKFDEAWRILGSRFYHPTLKDLDWPALGGFYRGLAEGARTSQAFNRIVGLLFGELDGSHLGIRGGDGFSGPRANTGYLGIDAEPAAGGYAIRRVLDDGPATAAGVALEAGDLLIVIEDQRLVDAAGEPLIDLDAAFEDRAGSETLIEVRRAGTEEPELLLVAPVSGGAERSLRYAHEIERRRQAVERLSNGRLGYLHIRGMNLPSVREFEQNLYAAANGREGLLIDVRDNGGGSTTDILLASLTAPRHAYTIPRGADPASVPADAYPRDRRLIYSYQRPIAVLINENSFSNAEIFAHSIRTTGRGRLIGTQTFGGVISTGSASLIDGTRVRTPFRGWYLPDGTDMEHNGALPDVDVPRLPSDEAAGRDAQLEAAVADLLATLGN